MSLSDEEKMELFKKRLTGTWDELVLVGGKKKKLTEEEKKRDEEFFEAAKKRVIMHQKERLKHKNED